MSRGLKGPRTVDPDSPEGVYFGMSDTTVDDVSPIPGGNIHLTNAPTVRNKVLTERASKPEFRGIMAHGVAPEAHTTHERAYFEAHGETNSVKTDKPRYLPRDESLPPVPVYVVENKAAGGRPLHTMAADVITVPAAGTGAVRICARDASRTKLKLLVETLAGLNGGAPTGIRVSHELGDLDCGRGILLSAAANTYQEFDVNDELYAISNDGSACTLSVVHFYDIAGAG